MILLADAVLAIKSDAEVNISGEDVTTIVWLDGNPTNITNQQILDKHAELQADYDAKQYQRDRTKRPEDGGYPSIGDQLDDLYHNGIDGWKATIKAIKDANPKP